MGPVPEDLRARAVLLRKEAADLRQRSYQMCREELEALAWGYEDMARQLERLTQPRSDPRTVFATMPAGGRGPEQLVKT